MNKHRYFVYMLASGRNGTLYIGVTGDLIRRVGEHKSNLIKGFTQKYSVHDLVWFDEIDIVEEAIAMEKRLKEWKRAWKIRLIEERNPEWNDLYFELIS